MTGFELAPSTATMQGKFSEIWVPWLRSVTGGDPEPEDLLAAGDPEFFYVKVALSCSRCRMASPWASWASEIIMGLLLGPAAGG
jgi:hypothetical protein